MENDAEGDFVIRAPDVEGAFRILTPDSPEMDALHGRCAVIRLLFLTQPLTGVAIAHGVVLGHANKAYPLDSSMAGMAMVSNGELFPSLSDLLIFLGPDPDLEVLTGFYGPQFSADKLSDHPGALATVSQALGSAVRACDVRAGAFALALQIFKEPEGAEQSVQWSIYNTNLSARERSCIGDHVSSRLETMDIPQGGICLGVKL